MNDTATQKGAARQESPDPDLNADEVVLETRPNPRNVQLEAMAARQEEARAQEITEAMAADPGLADEQHRIDKAIAEANAEAGITHEKNDGAASVQPMHQQPEKQPATLPSHLQDDPMADFIEMHDGAPMVKAKVNGQDRLIPLADAKRQIQIGVAAEVRMQNAAQRESQVDERERRLSAGEAALQARMNVSKKPSVPAQPDLSDEDLLEEAQDIFNTAFSGTEEDAAKKLASTLMKIRKSATTPAQQQIDPNEIARQAASMAYGTLTAESKKKDVQAGYTSFKQNYPDIVKDSYLFKMADDLTDKLEREHPDWGIAQVMDEAGKRTRAWVKDLAGTKEDTDGSSTSLPGADQNSQVATSSTQTRQDRKAGLVRMPTPAAGATFQEPDSADEKEQSPQEAFAQLRKARGQPV